MTANETSSDPDRSTQEQASTPAPWSRRSLLGGIGLAGAAAGGLALTNVPRAGATEVSERRRTADLQSGRPLLLRGGTVISMDPALGVLPASDVLVRSGRIEAVGAGQTAPADAEVLDVTGQLVLPGMIDTHRHMWQTMLRGIATEWTITDYVEWMFGRLGPLFAAEDIYAGSLLGAIEAIDSGVTTVVDWSHNMRTPAHADAAVDALLDSGIRARLAYGRYDSPAAQWAPGGDVARLLAERFPTVEDRVTLQLAIDNSQDPSFPERTAWEYARANGIPVTTHAGVWKLVGETPVVLRDSGLLMPTTTYVHAAVMSPEAYRLIAESGGNVSVATESDLSAGQGYPPTARLREAGIQTSLSVDTVSWFSGDMFSAMRATIAADRGLAHLRAQDGGGTVTSNALRTGDVLGYATVGGAQALGLADQLGSLTPGKRADLVVLDTSTPSMTPMNNPVGAVVLQAGRAEVDTVMVGGRVLKHGGRLLDDKLEGARRLAEASRDRLRAALGAQAWDQALNPARR